MKSNDLFSLSLPPQTRKRQEIPVAQLFDHTQMTIPVEVIRGREEGPILLLTGAMHGDEINGCEIIKRIFKHKNLVSRLKGTLVGVPIVNVFGFNANVRYLPDRRDLNRCFPGDPNGSLGAQVAHTLLNQIAVKCTHVIDFHTGALHRSNFPQVRAAFDLPSSRDLAEAFDVSVMLNSGLREGSFRKALNKRDIPCIVFEGGEALRYDEPAIRAGVHGALSVMHHLGMLEAHDIKLHPHKKPSLMACSSVWMRAPSSGSLRYSRKLGSRVKKGDTVGVISDPYGVRNVTLKSLHDGVIIGIRNLPLVMSGDAIIHVAIFESPTDVRREIELLDDEIDIYTF